MRFLVVFVSLITVATALNCYICNSLNQPDCTTNFQQFNRVCPVKSFSGLKAVKPVGCRVTRQYVNEETSIVRECAYTGENVEKKSNKGSLGVSRVYSQCSEPVCNSTNSSFHFFTAAVLVALYKLFS
uniref:Protein quiver n=1 Tax=Caenorhabditis tropicalis TaxID=1561998 RepID=A0A1I7UB57_9PELO